MSCWLIVFVVSGGSIFYSCVCWYFRPIEIGKLANRWAASGFSLPRICWYGIFWILLFSLTTLMDSACVWSNRCWCTYYWFNKRFFWWRFLLSLFSIIFPYCFKKFFNLKFDYHWLFENCSPTISIEDFQSSALLNYYTRIVFLVGDRILKKTF